MQPLRTMFQHHAWATLALIDHCAGLPPERLEATVPGTAGTIRHTLTHLVAADQRYLGHMDGQVPAIRVHEQEPCTLDDLRAAVEAQANRWRALVDRSEDLDVTIPAGARHGEIPGASDLLFLQAIHHGNDHRTHVCTVLGAVGLEPPDLAGWRYWESQEMDGP